MNLHTTLSEATPINVDIPRPANRRTHYHVGLELRSAKQRERCLALRLEGRKLRAIALEVGISPSTVNGYIHQALRASRQVATALGEQIREQERARLQAIIDRWQPVATGKYRTREAARAAEMVRKASDSLRVLFGLPVVAPSLPEVAEVEPSPTSSRPADVADLDPTPEQKLLFLAFDDIALRMARAGLLPASNYDAAYDALEQWQGEKYNPSAEVSDYLRANWAEMMALDLD